MATTLITFDAGDTSGYAFTDFGGAGTSLATTPPDGGSGKAAQLVKSVGAQTWAGTTFLSLGSSEMITTANNTMTMRVWSPDAGTVVRLKLEDSADPTHSVETEATTTIAGGWQTLSFNFANQAAGTAAFNDAYNFNKASVFFAFGSGGSGKTYYFDDVAYAESPLSTPAPTPVPTPAPTSAPSAVQVTFDSGDTSGYAFTDFGGAGTSLATTPPDGGSGKAAQVVKSVGAQTWAGTTFLSLGSSEMITAANKTVTMKVWSPDAGTAVRLKLEDSADVTHTVETEAVTTVAGGWQTLTFNFANQAAGTAAFNDAFNYNKASVFFAFGTGGSGKTYYFDDVAYAESPLSTPAPTPVPTPAPTPAPVASTVHVTFDSGDTSGYALTDFGGAGSSLETAPPTGGSGQAAKVVKSAGAADWAGTTFLTLGSSEMITAANKTVTMKVWSPDAGTAVRLKLEDSADVTHTVETEAVTTVAGGWQTLMFNFANQAAGTAAFNDAFNYNKASVFFAFGTGGSGKTYYFDDVAYAESPLSTPAPTPVPTPAPTPAPVASTVHVTFDSGDTSGYALTDFGGAGSSLETAPPTGGSGQAAKVVKSAGAADWAGTTFLTLGSSEMIAAANKTMTMRVWSPDAGTTVLLKLEDSADPTHSVQTEAVTTVAGGWQTLTFNFANQATGTAAFNDAYNYNKASVFFAFGSGGSGKTYYFDDVAYADRVASQGQTLAGSGSNDTLAPGFGNATVNAGAGVDTVILSMFPNVFSLSEPTPGQVTGSYANHTLVLNDVEFARFGTNFQTTIPLSTLVSGEAQLQLGQLTDLYLAFFGRAPDVSGLEYWQEQLLERGRDFATISKDFAFSNEAQALFPLAASNRAFVQTVYVNSFGRQPDAGGWDYWTGRLDGLGVTDLNDRGAFVGELILGAYAPTSGAEDRALLTNRHEAAMYYVNKLAIDPSEGFDAGINTLLARVTGNALTEDKAEQVIDYAFTHTVTLTGIMTDQALLDSIWGA